MKILTETTDRFLNLENIALVTNPQKRTILAQYASLQKQTSLKFTDRFYKEHIQFPYLLFIIKYQTSQGLPIKRTQQQVVYQTSFHFKALCAAFSQTPITLTTQVYSLPFANAYSNFQICLGEHKNYQTKFTNKQEMINYIINLFWTSPFSEIPYLVAKQKNLLNLPDKRMDTIEHLLLANIIH